MNRNKLPSWVNSVIDWIADHPMSVPGRLAAKRFGKPAPDARIGVNSFGDKRVRVLIAPVNYSGQGFVWARALEHLRADVSAKNMAVEVLGGFSYESDLLVPPATYHNDANWQRRQLEAVAQATHVLIEAEEPPFGRLFGRSVAAQTRELQRRGVSVAFLAHGTDVRLPSRHLKNDPLSPYRDPGMYVPRAEQLASRNIALVQNSGRPAFVSTPDLLLDLPDALWCPVAVDLERWARPGRAARPSGAPLRVAHAPSVAAMKGTHLMLPVLEKLQAEGVIEFHLFQGVPSAHMPAKFGGVDVVLDQFRVGSYGVAACEALAAGNVVVGHVSEQVRTSVHEKTGKGYLRYILTVS